MQEEHESAHSDKAQHSASQGQEVHQEDQGDIGRLRTENIMLRARIVQLTHRLVELELAAGGVRPYKVVSVPADERFKTALRKLKRKDSP